MSGLHGALAAMSHTQAIDFAIDHLGGAGDGSFDVAHVDGADAGHHDAIG